jgi:hypothetical protein
MKKRKYRVLEIRDRFYAQEKKWFVWMYLDNNFPEFIWSSYRDYHASCDSINEAELIIKRRIEYLIKNNPIVKIHIYNKHNEN